jgi:hypothetical protein
MEILFHAANQWKKAYDSVDLFAINAIYVKDDYGSFGFKIVIAGFGVGISINLE